MTKQMYWPFNVLVSLFCLAGIAKGDTFQVTARAKTLLTGQSEARLKPTAVNRSPWSSVVVMNASRAADIDHSKILNPQDPEARNEGSLAFIATLAYKIDSANGVNLTGAVTQDLIRDSKNEESAEPSVKNFRVGYTRTTELTILNSTPLALPFSISLPTSEAAQKAGFITSLRFWPILMWQLTPKISLAYGSKNDLTFTKTSDGNENFDLVLEGASLLTSNAVTASYMWNSMISISQTLGLGTMSKNLKDPGAMDQQGASFDIGTGVSLMPHPNMMFDLVINQSSPIQGAGLGTKVYDDNEFKIFHAAQTTYSVTTTLVF